MSDRPARASARPASDVDAENSGSRMRRLNDNDSVVVMCKLPNGLLLRGFEMVPKHEQMFGGGYREVTEAQPVEGAEFRCNGTSVNREKVLAGEMPPYLIMHGFAMTKGCPKWLWDQWWDANESAPYCKNGLVFAEPDEHSALDRARNGGKLRSGLEPIDPANPGPRSGTRGVKKYDPKDMGAAS